MFKWLVVCFIAIAVAKWNQNVQATDELNEEEKRLLETLEEKLDQETQETDVCETKECFMDYACASQCCSDQCVAADDYEGCMDVCMSDVPNTVSAAQNEGSPSEEVNKYQKKLWGARFRRVVRRVARRVVPVILARYVPTVVG
ncbi:uncharacterized protein LOC123540899 isoform X1 [Mercenaria mercenaria]|uniref:uncharacterized protein LOC123540899 isoform X1 n=1 Tax=Mercenaria mercenaria TaxID=6596 RepID=UPI00234FAE4D|nr:uncharacterized protein LOC123540899 isoform X1 [Mercenaria mercenaria]